MVLNYIGLPCAKFSELNFRLDHVFCCAYSYAQNCERCLTLLFQNFQITKRQVDRFEPGRRVPSCQLYVKWTGHQEQPVELAHRVKLLGAKKPFNFFLIRPPSLPLPPYLPQPPSSPSLQSMH